MNGRPFNKAEDAAILANPMLGPVQLARMIGRKCWQSVRDRREKLFDYEPPRIRGRAC